MAPSSSTHKDRGRDKKLPISFTSWMLGGPLVVTTNQDGETEVKAVRRLSKGCRDKEKDDDESDAFITVNCSNSWKRKERLSFSEALAEAKKLKEAVAAAAEKKKYIVFEEKEVEIRPVKKFRDVDSKKYKKGGCDCVKSHEKERDNNDSDDESSESDSDTEDKDEKKNKRGKKSKAMDGKQEYAKSTKSEKSTTIEDIDIDKVTSVNTAINAGTQPTSNRTWSPLQDTTIQALKALDKSWNDIAFIVGASKSEVKARAKELQARPLTPFVSNDSPAVSTPGTTHATVGSDSSPYVSGALADWDAATKAAESTSRFNDHVHDVHANGGSFGMGYRYDSGIGGSDTTINDTTGIPDFSNLFDDYPTKPSGKFSDNTVDVNASKDKPKKKQGDKAEQKNKTQGFGDDDDSFDGGFRGGVAKFRRLETQNDPNDPFYNQNPDGTKLGAGNISGTAFGKVGLDDPKTERKSSFAAGSQKKVNGSKKNTQEHAGANDAENVSPNTTSMKKNGGDDSKSQNQGGFNNSDHNDNNGFYRDHGNGNGFGSAFQHQGNFHPNGFTGFGAVNWNGGWGGYPYGFENYSNNSGFQNGFKDNNINNGGEGGVCGGCVNCQGEDFDQNGSQGQSSGFQSQHGSFAQQGGSNRTGSFQQDSFQNGGFPQSGFNGYYNGFAGYPNYPYHASQFHQYPTCPPPPGFTAFVSRSTPMSYNTPISNVAPRKLRPTTLWSVQDCLILEMLERNHREHKWLHVQAGFFNYTGRMVDAAIIENKFREDGLWTAEEIAKDMEFEQILKEVLEGRHRA